MFIEQRDTWVGDAILEARHRAEDPTPISPREMDGYVDRAVTAAGFGCPNRPRIAFDLAPGTAVTGFFDESEQLIHLQADELDPRDVLHMVAHWLAPEDQHDEPWRRHFVCLVAAMIGDENGDDLAVAFHIWKPIPPGASQWATMWRTSQGSSSSACR